jgi:phosphoadenosine phosphosulfate reductase
MTTRAELIIPKAQDYIVDESTPIVTEALEVLLDAHEQGNVVLASSLGVEDMILTDMIGRHMLSIGIFSLNTGRLNPETLAMLDKVKQTYKIDIEQYHPNTEAVIHFVKTEGVDAFYNSVELRKACCGIRKVEPLNRALAGKNGWITGQRKEQSGTRTELPLQTTDHDRNITKYNPLANWTEADVWRYVKSYQVPYNPLHDQGYPSLGCAPCTRPIALGEDIRAGRWWWEDPDSKECGLHVSQSSIVKTS